ncbi:MAG: energy transducer TonB [Anaeromyxobacter sp.]
MFDEVTKKEGGKNAARRAGFVFGSTAFQFGLVVLVLWASAKVSRAIVEQAPVEVKFVKQAAPPPPPPPPAAPPPRPKNKPPPTDKPKTDAPKPPPPQALIQPQEVQQEMKEDTSPKEPDYDYGDDSAASGEGVIGGVVGGAPAQNEVEDAPAYATTGYRKPEMAKKFCVQEAVRVPRELQGFVSSVTVRFAIGRDGTPSQFQVMSNVPDKRIGDAIWTAVQSCKWVPGADPQGRPTSIWVILPIRFAQ